MANPAYVQGIVGTGTSAGVTTFSKAFGSNVGAGNSVLVFITGSLAGGPVITSVVDSQSNHYAFVGKSPAGGGGSGNVTFAYFFSGVSAGALTVTVNYASSTQYTVMNLREYSNAPNVLLFAPGNGASGTALTSLNAVTFGANQMVVGCGFTQATAAVLTAGSGFGNLIQGGSATNFVAGSEDLLETSQGTFATTFTANASSDWSCMLVAVGNPPATLTNGTVVLGTNGGAGSIIGTAGGGNDPNSNPTTNALVFDAGSQTQATPTAGGSWTQWYNPDASGDYVGIDCGAAISCNNVLLSFNNPAFANVLVSPGTAQFQASNDVAFGTFTVLFTLANANFGGSIPLWGTLQNNIQFPLAGMYRYYRITLPALASAPADLEFYGQYYSGVSATCSPVSITNFNGTTGGNYDAPVRVRMSCVTTGAAIWYTVDGTTPSAGGGTSVQYGGPIIISSNTLVQAIAVLSGLSNSRITQALYHIGSLVPTDRPYSVNRNGYRIFSIAGDKFQDTNSGSSTYGAWFWYGMNSDQNGVFEHTGPGIDCYQSPDLRNWTYVSNTSNIGQGQAQFNRVSVVYNAANNNYVLWIQQGLSANMAVYTATSPLGPWTQSGSTITSMDGYSTKGDHKLFLDSNANCYLIFDTNSGPLPDANYYTTIHLLNSTYTASSGSFVAYNNNTSGNTTPFGQQSEGFAMFKIGSTYYWAASNLSPWTPGVNYYVTNTTGPLGTWSAPVNPFQPDANELTDGAAGFWGPGPLTPSQNYAYDSQTDGFYIIPGRHGINFGGTPAIIYVGDRWDFQAFGVIQTNNDSFQGWRHIVLPVAVNPSTGALTINWTNNWTFDQKFQQGTNLPSAASGINVTTGASYTITWTNNETKAYALYLDRATNVYFTQNVVSEVLAPGTTSFVDSTVVGGTTYFYRVRTVNASGSANDPVTPSQSGGGVGGSLIGPYNFWGGGHS